MDASTLETKLARQAELKPHPQVRGRRRRGSRSGPRSHEPGWPSSTSRKGALEGSSLVGSTSWRPVAATALDLSNKRTRARRDLPRPCRRLSGLAMADADFTVKVGLMPAREDDGSPLRLPSGELVHAGSGWDRCRRIRLLRTAVPMSLPLTKSASGGELSRVMLALEVVLAGSGQGVTMVFDEIDAASVGVRRSRSVVGLARLARSHQVIVSDAPAPGRRVRRCASRGPQRGRTSEVRRLTTTNVAELARMLAGLGESDTGRAHARELWRLRRRTRPRVSQTPKLLRM